MRKVHLLAFFVVLLVGCSIPAFAQGKRKPARPAPRATPKPVKPYVNPDVAAARTKVSNQLANVNMFVDKLGPIAVSIEAIDKDARARKPSKTVIDANEANKKKLIAAIRGLREGLVLLESDFRTRSALTRYLPQLQGIGDLCARSEDSAIAGRFVLAKDPLRDVAQKLTDTLAVMPK